MNKKEVAEIKKNFSESSGLFTVNHVLSVYVDAQKNVKYISNRLHSIIPEDEGAIMLDMMKKVLSGSVGKGLLEYRFPNEAYEDGGMQKILYTLVKSKLEDETAVAEYIKRIVEKMEYEPAYTIIAGLCSYSIMTKDKNDEDSDNAFDEYNFVITAVCPVNTGDSGLIYDSETESLVKKLNTEMVVSKAPSDGFVFPVFSERTPDINAVMYYTRKPDKPNISIVNELLQCEFTMSAKSERECFKDVLNTVVGDELDFTVINSVNEKVLEVVEAGKHETEIPVIDSTRLKTILSDSGVSDEKLQNLEPVYKDKVGSVPLTATNLTETKTVVELPEITVNITKAGTDKVRTGVIGGKKCLIIDLDNPKIKINGLDTLVAAPETSNV